MAVPRFLPKHLGGEADRVDGGGVRLPMPGSPAALARREALLATARVDAHHSVYVEHGATTADPTLLPGYDAAAPEPGALLMVMDREGWATMHRIEARGAGKIEFGPRLPWPDGSIAARRLP